MCGRLMNAFPAHFFRSTSARYQAHYASMGTYKVFATFHDQVLTTALTKSKTLQIHARHSSANI